MIDQKARLKEKGKDFAPRLSTEILKSLKRAHTVFTIMSSENNHNTFFLKEFEKEVVASLKRQSRKKNVLSINIQVNEKDVLDDQHYQEANYHVLLSSLWRDYTTTWNQSKRMTKRDRLKYMLFGLGILVLPFLLFFIYYYLGDESIKDSDYLTFILALAGLGGLFKFFDKKLIEKIEQVKKADRGFSFEKAQIKRRLKKLGFRRKPTLILIDNAEALDKGPFRILLDAMDEDIALYPYGVLWVFLFANKSDRSDELAERVYEKKLLNQLLDLNPYSEKDLQSILSSDASLRRRGSYLISDKEETYIDQLHDRWVDICEKIDNKEAFTEYDI